MRSILPFLVALLAIPLTYSTANACIQGTAYGTLTANANVLTSQTIETCNYAGEYATVSIPGAGDWTFESSVGTDYLYITDASNVAIDSGTSPLTLTTTGAITIRLHISTNSSCGTQSTCRVTSVTKAPCFASTAYGTLTASATTFTTQTIETCNYAGEYATVILPSGGTWTFGSSVSTDFFVLTDQTNGILASGVQPLDYVATGADTVRLHIFTDNACGTQSNCRVTTVTKSPCLASSLYPANVVLADSNIGVSTTITTCNYAGEYSQVALPAAGNWQFTSSDTGDFIVITDLNNAVLASGPVPVDLSISLADTVRAHIFTDANCGTENSCRVTSVVRAPCLSSSLYPANIDTVNTDPSLMTVSTCNYAGEYFEVVAYPGQTYEFSSSDTGDIFFLTDTANNFLTSGVTPFTYSVMGSAAMGIRAHIFIDNGCGTENSCRETTIRCISCAPSITPASASICDGAGAFTLTASDTLGTTYWYAGACGSTPIDSGSTADVTPSSTTWYYASNFYAGVASFCDSVEVSVNDNPTIAFSNVMDATCAGDMNGGATVDPSGGMMPYSYAWSNSDTMATVTSFGAGDYIVTVTDDNGCTAHDTVSISEPDSLIASIAASLDPDCNGAMTGEVTSAATGGTTPYAYAWSSGGTAVAEVGLGAGAYTVTVTDANGCTTEVGETLAEPAAISNAFTSTDATCESGSDGEILSAVAGGTAPYSYSWSNSNTTSDVTGLSAGTYTVVVTDDNGCTYTESDSVGFMFADPTIALDDVDTLCTGFSITLDAGNAGSTFSWSTSATTQTIDISAAGDYTVDVTDANGCSASHTISIIEDACLGINDVASQTIIETYPNPANGILNVRIKGSNQSDIVVELLSLSGQRIETRNVMGAGSEIFEQFDVSSLSQGVYLMNFMIDSQVTTQRIIVQ